VRPLDVTTISKELSNIHKASLGTQNAILKLSDSLQTCVSSSTDNAALLNSVLTKLSDQLITVLSPQHNYLQDLLKAHNEKLQGGLYVIIIGENTRIMTSKETATFITDKFPDSSVMIVGDLQELSKVDESSLGQKEDTNIPESIEENKDKPKDDNEDEDDDGDDKQ
jgi:hypothetical protein